ncbi:MAG: hypothetical protein LBQ12_10775 [Deltaproteobacteria bacterium]|nr:hypothetical protein [Deltaproteobacteria bacterium]
MSSLSRADQEVSLALPLTLPFPPFSYFAPLSRQSYFKKLQLFSRRFSEPEAASFFTGLRYAGLLRSVGEKPVILDKAMLA